MQINQDLLFNDDGTQIAYYDSPNCDRNQTLLVPEYLVIHFTTGNNPQSTIATFMNPAQQVSAHLLIDRSGNVSQFVPFNRPAWHAGYGSWAERRGLRRYSIGIELDNFGPLKKVDGQWLGLGKYPVEEKDVIEETHKYEVMQRGWQTYTSEQIEALVQVGKLLFATYPLIDVLGHEDFSTSQKVDPGPSFPMDWFRRQMLDAAPDAVLIYTTTKNMVLRKEPKESAGTVPGSFQLNGSRVGIMDRTRGWADVIALDANGILTGLRGWVQERFLKRVA